MVFDDFCAYVFQGMLVEGPPGPEGPTVSQSGSDSSLQVSRFQVPYLFCPFSSLFPSVPLHHCHYSLYTVDK